MSAARARRKLLGTTSHATKIRISFSGVIRELIVSGSGEEDMSALLCGMHAAPNDALRLKLHILKALLACLRDSHRTRTIFRKVSETHVKDILLIYIQDSVLQIFLRR